MSTISLSPSKLGVLRNCARCFYLANTQKIGQPRGIFPSLPGGVDRVMKDYMDQYRGSLPPSLKGAINGVLWGTVAEINKLRNWRSGLKAVVVIGDVTVSLIGALDDLIQEADVTYSPFDTKTKGDLPKDDGAQYYQTQLDCYALMLRENGKTPSGKAYLDYHYPVQATDGSMTFAHVLYPLTASPERAIETIAKAVAVLSEKTPPAANDECEYCGHHQALMAAGF